MGSALDTVESIGQLLLSLEQLEDQRHMDKSEVDDIDFLRRMFQTSQFYSLLNAHNIVLNCTKPNAPRPLIPNALMLANIVLYDAEEGHTPLEEELYQLLSLPHITAILSAHDKVANKEYPMQSATVVGTEKWARHDNFPGPVRVVYVEKKDKPLGATVKKDADGRIFISRVLCGCVASRSGMIHQGDVLLEINGKSIRGWSIDHVATFIQSLSGTITFKISPAMDAVSTNRRVKECVSMKSLVTYNPNQDESHPCPEAGLVLYKGMVLHVVDQDDPDWWQAVIDGEERDKVGLIPSKKRLELAYSKNTSSKKKYRGRHISYHNFRSTGTLGNEMISYEEIVKITPQPGRPRPLLLVAPQRGPFTLGDLRDKLLSESPSIFASPVQHTSRLPSQSKENRDHNYHFVTSRYMERDIMNGKMIEFSLVHGSYYGTSVRAIKDVINSSKTCLLIVDPQAIKTVRTSELWPFIVYFSAPSANFMKENWVPGNRIRDSDVLDIVRQATYLEQQYGHFFDLIMDLADINSAYMDIVRLAEILRSNQQWVPTAWLD